MCKKLFFLLLVLGVVVGTASVASAQIITAIAVEVASKSPFSAQPGI